MRSSLAGRTAMIAGFLQFQSLKAHKVADQARLFAIACIRLLGEMLLLIMK